MKYLTARVNDKIKNANWLLEPNGLETDMGFLSQQTVEVIGYYPSANDPANLICIALYRHGGDIFVYNFTSKYLDVSNELIEKTFNGVPSKPIPQLHIPLTSSVDFLNAAKRTQEERATEYDSPEGERSFQQVATAFNAVTGKDLKGSEVALIQQILKDVRQWKNPERIHEDSLIDGVSYASLKAGELVREVNLKEPF